MNARTLLLSLMVGTLCLAGIKAFAGDDMPRMDMKKDIVDTAVAAGNFKTLAAALGAAASAARAGTKGSAAIDASTVRRCIYFPCK